MNVLGIDIGGSALKGAPVETKTGRLLEKRLRIATPELLSPKQMAGAVKQFVGHFNWKGPIGVGFPGVVHANAISTSANLHPDFIGCDAGKLFAKATGCPVSVVNDADAAGIAEVALGAGRGKAGTILLLTFGTGVGSALFVDGRLYPNSELGHLPLEGKSAERRVSAAAREKHNLSFKDWGCRVSEYLNILELILQPQLIIVGGGVSADHEKWFKHLTLKTPIVPAGFLNEAGIVGAALWAVR